MTTLREWLQRQGLEQYAEAFEREAIEVDLLPDLTDAQLQSIGVSMLGHRLRLLRAAAGLRAADAMLPASAAERRQLTVMFCDLVGSTDLSQRMDPEDLRALMRAYQRTCSDIVSRHQGTVAQYLGDGLMVYFGWPQAHEDAAGCAVLAALGIVDAVKTIAAPEPVRVRIGIATGPVVVGAGDDPDELRTAIGETPNLAARLQALAQPDQVLIAASTRRLVADACECQDIGEFGLKGIAQPVRVWRVIGEGRAEGRFAAAHGERLTPLVNRELELSLMKDRWARAREGEGQAVLLVGEPGIGKSRVIAEVCSQVAPGGVMLHLQCAELHRTSAFYPLVQGTLRGAGVRRGDDETTRFDKLEALLQRVGAPVAERAPYFASLLSWPLAARYPAFAVSPAKLKSEVVRAIVQTALDAARQRPQVLVAEDLHWMDPSSLEVMDALVAAMRHSRLLLIMTSRHAMGDRWAGQPHLTSLTMVGLSRSHSLQLAASVAASRQLLPRMLERIVERTDGVPLFVEELTRTLAEAGTRAEDRDADAVEIPSTLKDSLAARLDRLGAAKRMAQLGSVIGRQFRHDLLLALHGSQEAALAPLVEPLLTAGLVGVRGEAAERVYTFRHALIQDAAYESLLKTGRRSLHAKLCEILSARFPEIAEQEPELLARHATLGEVWDRAAPLWLKAGQRAWARSASAEAIAHLEAGLAIVERVSDPALRDALELGMRATLGAVYFAAVSYAAPQAQAAFERASQLCERVTDRAARIPVLYGMGTFLTMKGDAPAGHHAFERLAAEAEAIGQPRLQMYAHALLAWSSYTIGEHDRCLAAAAAARRLYDAGAIAGPRLTASDPRVVFDCFQALAWWATGQVDRARAASDELLAFARGLGDPYSLAYSLNYAALMVPMLCGEVDTVAERAAEGVRFAAELGYPMLEVAGLLRVAWARGQRGDVDGALADFDDAVGRLDAMGVGYHRGELLGQRARLQLRSGQVGAAQLTVAQALAWLDASGVQAIAPDLYLAEGEVLLARGGEQRELARSAFQLAFDVARTQGALSWQLRAAMALAPLAAAEQGAAAARAVLEPVLARFTEGHATADLQRAAALLAGWTNRA